MQLQKTYSMFSLSYKLDATVKIRDKLSIHTYTLKVQVGSRSAKGLCSNEVLFVGNDYRQYGGINLSNLI